MEKDRNVIANGIAAKLKSGKKLTKKEIEFICDTITDPEGEFCRREARFRLLEIHNCSTKMAEALESYAEESIRGTFDETDYFYDALDDNLRNDVLDKTFKVKIHVKSIDYAIEDEDIVDLVDGDNEAAFEAKRQEILAGLPKQLDFVLNVIPGDIDDESLGDDVANEISERTAWLIYDCDFDVVKAIEEED